MSHNSNASSSVPSSPSTSSTASSYSTYSNINHDQSPLLTSFTFSKTHHYLDLKNGVLTERESCWLGRAWRWVFSTLGLCDTTIMACAKQSFEALTQLIDSHSNNKKCVFKEKRITDKRLCEIAKNMLIVFDSLKLQECPQRSLTIKKLFDFIATKGIYKELSSIQKLIPDFKAYLNNCLRIAHQVSKSLDEREFKKLNYFRRLGYVFSTDHQKSQSLALNCAKRLNVKALQWLRESTCFLEPGYYAEIARLAALSGVVEMLLFIKHSGYAFSQEDFNEMAIDATVLGHIEVLKFLIKEGFDLHKASLNGQDLRAVAKQNSQILALIYIQSH
jgi:hypothetical protein